MPTSTRQYAGLTPPVPEAAKSGGTSGQPVFRIHRIRGFRPIRVEMAQQQIGEIEPLFRQAENIASGFARIRLHPNEAEPRFPVRTAFAEKLAISYCRGAQNTDRYAQLLLRRPAPIMTGGDIEKEPHDLDIETIALFMEFRNNTIQLQCIVLQIGNIVQCWRPLLDIFIREKGSGTYPGMDTRIPNYALPSDRGMRSRPCCRLHFGISFTAMKKAVG